MAYLAPIHRPSSIRHAIKLSFLAPDDENLIVAKANRLEIYAQTPDGLVLQHSKALYGKVSMLHKLRPASSQTDHLFVGTDRYMYFTLSWDSSIKQLKTEKSYQDLAEKTSRDSQTGDRCHVDPTRKFMTLEIYEGVVNVVPISHQGKGKRKAAEVEIGELGDPVPVRIPELFVRASAFIYKRETGKLAQDRPELALLFEDSQNRVRLKIRELEYSPSLRPNEEPATVELEKGKDAQGDIELGASHLIPLPGPTYGILIIGETSIGYCEEWEHRVITEPLDEATIFVAWCAIDDQRFCLADDYGKLYLLFVKRNNSGEYNGWQLDVLGETSRASTLVYLDAGKIFVGSHQGDSQVIQISEKDLEVIQTFPNIGPILDFTVMDMGNRTSDAPVNEYSSGQARIVTGSGAYKDGSLRSVRSGVGLEDLGSIGEMAHATELFSLRSSPASAFADTLVASFVSHTRVFQFDSDGQVEEAEDFKGFDMSESTLHACNLLDGRLVQVTSSAVMLIDADSGMVTDSWKAPRDGTITAVSAAGSSILLSLKGATLVALDVSGSEVKVQAQQEFDSAHQISCVTLSSAFPEVCVVGFWQEARVSVLDLRTLQAIRSETVEEGLAVPRSLLIASVLQDSPPTLFVGMADGNVVTYSVDPKNGTLSARKSIILGTQQANFRALPLGNGLDNVFATCEHPSLIYGSEGRMVYSAVTAENAACVCPFDAEAYPNAIAIATDSELKLAVVDEERTTHVQTLPVHETVRRIAYSPDLKAFGLGTIKRVLAAGREDMHCHFKLVDEIAFQELHTFALNRDELFESCMRAKLADGSGGETERFVVGTSYLDDESPEAARGRILVFEVTESRQLKLIAEHALKGGCRCLAMCNGRIVAALIKTVVAFAFEYETASQPFLVKAAAYRTATAPIDISVAGDKIAVADLMKSVSIVQHARGRGGMPDALTEVARHFETTWGTAVANVGTNTFLEADAEGNLVVLNHEAAGFSADDRRRLRVTSEMHLGELVNRIRRVDVQPTPAAVVHPRAFLATVEGSIYLFALIAPGKQDLLMRLQAELAARVLAPGHVPFETYRGFKNSVRDMGAEGPSRFVDGELVERFLDCPEDVQLAVLGALGGTMELEELRGMIEGLRRIH